MTLIGLAAVLPGPGQFAAQLGGHRAPAPAPVTDTAMLLVAALVVWSLLIWILGIAAVAAVGGRPGAAGRRARQLLRHMAPAAVRNVLLTVAGVSLLPGLTACATAAPTDHPSQFDSRTVVAAGSAGLQPHPADQLDIDWPATVQPAAHRESAQIGVDRPAAGKLGRPTTPLATGTANTAQISLDWPTGDPANKSARETAAGGAVVVHRGDSLWSIAARHLPAKATAADIAQLGHRWYATNATVIGPDPNLILPGQILLPPTQKTGE
jgi:hypothetical protein